MQKLRKYKEKKLKKKKIIVKKSDKVIVKKDKIEVKETIIANENSDKDSEKTGWWSK